MSRATFSKEGGFALVIQHQGQKAAFPEESDEIDVHCCRQLSVAILISQSYIRPLKFPGDVEGLSVHAAPSNHGHAKR